MSISFSAADLQPTYNSIVDGSSEYDWAIFNQTGNELKVQATGSGLDDLEEQFMDGRQVGLVCHGSGLTRASQDPVRVR